MFSYSSPQRSFWETQITSLSLSNCHLISLRAVGATELAKQSGQESRAELEQLTLIYFF